MKRVTHPFGRRDVIGALPPTLNRLMLSNRRRHDPNHSNRQQTDQSSVIASELLLSVIQKCPRLRLMMIETGNQRFGSLKIARKSILKLGFEN